jgi:hypothetical protein
MGTKVLKEHAVSISRVNSEVAVPLKVSTNVLQYIVLISEDCILNMDGLDGFNLVHL